MLTGQESHRGTPGSAHPLCCVSWELLRPGASSPTSPHSGKAPGFLLLSHYDASHTKENTNAQNVRSGPQLTEGTRDGSGGGDALSGGGSGALTLPLTGWPCGFGKRRRRREGLYQAVCRHTCPGALVWEDRVGFLEASRAPGLESHDPEQTGWTAPRRCERVVRCCSGWVRPPSRLPGTCQQ